MRGLVVPKTDFLEYNPLNSGSRLVANTPQCHIYTATLFHSGSTLVRVHIKRLGGSLDV